MTKQSAKQRAWERHKYHRGCCFTDGFDAGYRAGMRQAKALAKRRVKKARKR